jgi:hypothetical protein
MITRMWCGWAPSEDAYAYQRFLLKHLFPSMCAIPGFLDKRALHFETAPFVLPEPHASGRMAG